MVLPPYTLLCSTSACSLKHTTHRVKPPTAADTSLQFGRPCVNRCFSSPSAFTPFSCSLLCGQFRRVGLFPAKQSRSQPAADSCFPDQAAPVCMVVSQLLQRFNKCRKGRKVSVRLFSLRFRVLCAARQQVNSITASKATLLYSSCCSS